MRPFNAKHPLASTHPDQEPGHKPLSGQGLASHAFPNRRAFLRLGSWGVAAAGAGLDLGVDEPRHPGASRTGAWMLIAGLLGASIEKVLHNSDVRCAAEAAYESFKAEHPLTDERLAYVCGGEVRVIRASGLSVRGKPHSDALAISDRKVVSIQRAGPGELIVLAEKKVRQFYGMLGGISHELYLLDVDSRSFRKVFDRTMLQHSPGTVEIKHLRFDPENRTVWLVPTRTWVSIRLDTGELVEHGHSKVAVPDLREERGSIGAGAYELAPYYVPQGEDPVLQCWQLLPVTHAGWLNKAWAPTKGIKLPKDAWSPVVLT
jgi:hypothetical protein